MQCANIRDIYEHHNVKAYIFFTMIEFGRRRPRRGRLHLVIPQ